jgi:RNA polymerase sigma factor (sigma-70 family)
MNHPILKTAKSQDRDLTLVNRALSGSRDDLEIILVTHQSWIYNIAVRMLYDPDDAADVTQEVLIKIITKLSSYDPKKAAFRTWLYRVVVNHIMNVKKRKIESPVMAFEDYFDTDKFPDKDLSYRPENNILIEELKISCYLGSLLCFDRRQRMIFILGAILNIPDSTGSKIMDISKSNFRKILSRSRSKLKYFLDQKCGLLNEANPCHCARKIEGLIDAGMMHPDKIIFYKNKTRTVKDILSDKIKGFDKYWTHKYEEYNRQFLDHPFYEPRDLSKWLHEVTDVDVLKKFENILERSRFVE